MLLRHALFVLLFLALPLSPASAQTADGQFVVTTEGPGGTCLEGQARVTLEVKADGASFELGTSTFMFTFDAAVVAIPSGATVNQSLVEGTDYVFRDAFVRDLGFSAFYSPDAGVFGTANRISATVTYQGNQGDGTTVTTSYQSVADFCFDVLNSSGNPAMTWVLASDPNPVSLFIDDNTTAVTNGAFTDNNTPLPVELLSFNALTSGDVIRLSWHTASETNNAGFDVEYRPAATANGASVAEKASWTKAGFVEGHGTTTEAQRYNYRVEGLLPGRYVFRLRQVDFDGQFANSPEVEAVVGMSEAYLLSAPWPNPAQGTARLRVAVRESERVDVAVYDALGRRVAVLHKGTLPAGQAQELEWNIDNVATGTYFVRMASKAGVQTKVLHVIQ